MTETPIVAIVPRGEVIRNFVYSEALDRVAESRNVTLLSISANETLDKLLHDRYNTVFPLEEQPERWPVRFQRELLDISHNRWLWSRAAKERSRLRDAEARSLAQKTKRALKKGLGYSFATRSGLTFLNSLERMSSKRLRTGNFYESLFRETKPALVFNGSHIHSRIATQAVQAAQWIGIPTATFIFSWDNLTSQGRITLPYDYFLVWNQAIKEQLLSMYDWISPESVFVTGTPQFDFHFQDKFYLSREAYCERLGLDSGRPFIFYATGMANHMPGEPEIVEDIADALAQYPEAGRPQLVVRVYPKDRTGRFNELMARRSDIVFPAVDWEESWLTPAYEDSYALINALRHCAVGINVASTVSLELCMFDTPVINIAYNPPSVPTSELSYADYYEFDHYKPVVDSGAVAVARSPDELRKQLHVFLGDRQVNSGNRKELIQKMFGETLDGKSAVRVADTLLALADKARSTRLEN